MNTSPVVQEALESIRQTIRVSKKTNATTVTHAKRVPTDLWEREVDGLLELLEKAIEQYMGFADKYLPDPFSKEYDSILLYATTMEKIIKSTRERVKKYKALEISVSTPKKT